MGLKKTFQYKPNYKARSCGFGIRKTFYYPGRGHLHNATHSYYVSNYVDMKLVTPDKANLDAIDLIEVD